MEIKPEEESLFLGQRSILSSHGRRRRRHLLFLPFQLEKKIQFLSKKRKKKKEEEDGNSLKCHNFPQVKILRLFGVITRVNVVVGVGWFRMEVVEEWRGMMVIENGSNGHAFLCSANLDDHGSPMT
ncbi:hypothetical protein Leryth_003687 [Lithospermum erythrorhizon]|nr:hypothetical protein Leryth_003687 [Lithospermum erythrorhizon]